MVDTSIIDIFNNSHKMAYKTLPTDAQLHSLLRTANALKVENESMRAFIQRIGPQLPIGLRDEYEEKYGREKEESD